MFALRRFASAFALCALFLGILAVAVQAASVPRFETNGQRMARGLTPLRPRALYPDSTSTFLYNAGDTYADGGLCSGCPSLDDVVQAEHVRSLRRQCIFRVVDRRVSAAPPA
jgi:hypothetical protein